MTQREYVDSLNDAAVLRRAADLLWELGGFESGNERLRAMVDRLLVMAIKMRESGGSFSAAADPVSTVDPSRIEPQPPVPNKSGGCGDVMEDGFGVRVECSRPKGHAGRHTDGGDEWS